MHRQINVFIFASSNIECANMCSEDIRKYKDENIPYQLGRLKLLLARRFGRILKREGIGLTSEQVNLLGVLIEKGTCFMDEIASELLVDNSAVTRLIDGLESKKLVKRTISKQDRRQRLVQITPKGEDKIYRTMQLTEKYREKLLVGISESEKQNFLRMLLVLQKNAEKALAELEIE